MNYYLHISYMIPLINRQVAYSDALVRYNGGDNMAALRAKLRDCEDNPLIDKNSLPIIISINILPEDLSNALTQP